MTDHPMNTLEDAARAIIRQRDYYAEHVHYDLHDYHPDGACFDDWAADLLEAALGVDHQPAEAPTDALPAWQAVAERKYGERTERLTVPGGWLYRVTLEGFTENAPRTAALCFIPHPPRPR